MMYRYRYSGEGMLVVKIDGVRYKFANNHPTLPNELELPKKVEIKNLERTDERAISKSKKKGE